MHVDDRDDATPGFKFNDWELKGVPLRIEIGPRDVESGSVVAVRRHDGRKESMDVKDLGPAVRGVLEEIQEAMLQKAREKAAGMTFDVSEYAEFKERCGTGFVRAAWCGDEKCEESIKDETGAEIRVIPLGEEKEKGEQGSICIICGGQGLSTPIFAKGY